MADSGLAPIDPPPQPSPASPPAALVVGAGREDAGAGDAAVSRAGLLEVKARPLRRDFSGIMGQFLVLMAVVLCPLLVAPWLWYRRERFRLNRCRVRIEGGALLLYHQQRQLLALDLRYTSRELTAGGDLVLSEEEAHYLALGVEPPEHCYPDSAELAARRGAGAAIAALSVGIERAAPEGSGSSRPPQIRTWRAVRLAPADLMRLCAAVSAVPLRQQPEAGDVGSLLQALGSVGATGRRAEGQLSRLVQADLAQARPSSLLSMLQERALEEGPAATAARRVLSARALAL